MAPQLVTVTPGGEWGREPTALHGPVWGLRIDGGRVSIVLQGARLPEGAVVHELVVQLPHVGFPFDFREGVARFRHHRGQADGLTIAVEARVLLDWLHRASGGRLTGRAFDDMLVLSGRLDAGPRFTVRARFFPDDGEDAGARGAEAPDEPLLVLSLYDVRVYGRHDEPWPLVCRRILDLLPERLVAERSLTTARLRLTRPALMWALSALGWKLPDLSRLRPVGVELRDGRLVARFASTDLVGPLVTLDAMPDGALRGAFERFVEDLELKRHHGQIDRLLEAGQVREALAEVYRALDGPPRPGFLAERLIGICAARPILYDEGDKVCRALLAQAPTYAPALCGLAAIALGRGRPEEAAVQLERLSAALGAPSEREDATCADLTLAESLRGVDAEEARLALERVLDRSPDHEEALEALIALAEDAGDTAATLPLYKRLLFAARSGERTRDAGLRLARHALERKQPEEARVFLRVVLEASPADLDAQLALSDVETQQGNVAEAVRLLETALRVVPPTDGDLMMRIVSRLAALALGPLRDPVRARRVLWRAVDVVGLGDEAALELARQAIAAGEAELADRYGERIGHKSPLWPRAACLRARAWLLRGARERAWATALEVIERSPGDGEALELLEQCATDVGGRERLLTVLREALERASTGAERARLARSLARVYEALELDWDAIGPYEQVLREAPGAPLAEGVGQRLLELYGRFGMWPEHQTLCRAALGRVSDPGERVPLLVRLGRAALRELGAADEARGPLEEAVRLAPRRIEGLELLRDALEALGDGAALAPVLQRLEAIHPDERVRFAARLRLAEVQLDALGAPGQARATLARLPASEQGGGRVRDLKQRLGLLAPEPAAGGVQAEVRPTAPAPKAEVVVAAGRPESAYDEALARADRGDVAGALERLERLFEAEPLHLPGLELARLLAVEAGDVERALEVADTLLELMVSRSARRALLEELVAQTPAGHEARRRRWAAMLAALEGPRPAAAAAPAVAKAVEAPAAAVEAPAAREGRREAEEALPQPVAARVDEGDELQRLLGEAAEHLFAGAWPAARAALERALAIDGDCVPALELLAEGLREQGEFEALERALGRLADLAFDAEQTLAYLRERGEVLADGLGDVEGAAEVWARYLDWQPLDDAVMQRLAGFYGREGRHAELAALWGRRAERAQEAAEEAFEARPLERAAARARLEEARLRLERLDDAEGAVAAAEAGLALAPQDPELMICRVRALAVANRRSECRAAIDQLMPLLMPGPLMDEMRLLRGDG